MRKFPSLNKKDIEILIHLLKNRGEVILYDIIKGYYWKNNSNSEIKISESNVKKLCRCFLLNYRPNRTSIIDEYKLSLTIDEILEEVLKCSKVDTTELRSILFLKKE